MRRGVSLVDGALTLPDLAGVAARAAAAGYDTIWTNETPGRDAFMILASWAPVTGTARLGIGVSPVYVRPPLTAAGAAAALTAMAGPRLVLGIGSGHREAARRNFGIDQPPPLAAVRDYGTITRRLLAGERVSYEGEAFSLESAALPHTPAGPVPVVVGAMGPKMLEVAAECTDGVLVNWTSPAALAELAGRLRDRAGAGFEISAYVRVAVSGHREAARAALAADFAGYLRLPAYRAHLARQGHPEVAAAVGMAWEAGGRDAAAAALPDEVLAQYGAFGPQSECREMLGRYRHTGIDELVVRPVPVGSGGIWEAAEAAAPGAGGG